MFKNILVGFFLFLGFYANAQTIDPIEIDRPDQTECPAIVPVGMFQMENGFNFEKVDADSTTLLLPSSLLKVGIYNNFELRLITEFTIQETLTEKTIGLKPIYFGFKIKICEEKGWLPKTSLITHILLPKFASEDLKTNYAAPKFRFTMQHTLTEKIGISYNLGTEWSGETAEKAFIYTLTSSYKINKKWGSYLEIYGFIPDNQNPDHRYDGGFTYLLNNNVIFDLSGGFGITANAPRSYISLGFSFRV